MTDKHSMGRWNDTWYHVTERSNLPEIQRNGIQPVQHQEDPSHTVEWVPRLQDHVYVFPGYEHAAQWAGTMAFNDKLQDPVILKMQGLDRDNIGGDPERLADVMQQTFKKRPHEDYDWEKGYDWREDARKEGIEEGTSEWQEWYEPREDLHKLMQQHGVGDPYEELGNTSKDKVRIPKAIEVWNHMPDGIGRDLADYADPEPMWEYDERPEDMRHPDDGGMTHEGPIHPSKVVDWDHGDWREQYGNLLPERIRRPKRTAAALPELHGPIPLVYDIEGDRVYVGQPGERHADIQGKFSPGGVVEGVYDPKGNLQIRTDTDMPWTVYHLTRLWYAMHPELEIKHIYRLVGEERYRLASVHIAAKCLKVLACDPLWEPAQELLEYGNVYVAGETVRDIVQRRPLAPGDLRIAVEGVDPDIIREVVTRHAGVGALVRVAMMGFETAERHLASIDRDRVLVSLATGELIDPYHETERMISEGHNQFDQLRSQSSASNAEEEYDEWWEQDKRFDEVGREMMRRHLDGELSPDEAASMRRRIKDEWYRQIDEVPEELRATDYRFKEGDRVNDQWVTHPDARAKIPGWPDVVDNPGRVIEVKHDPGGTVYHVQYDDGHQGWTSPDNLVPHKSTDMGDFEAHLGERTKRTSNILDPVKDTLSEHVFDDPTSAAPNVKPEIVDFVRKTITDAMVEAGWPDPEEYLTLVLTGSLCTYQYDDTGPSDFDVSLFIDAARMPEWVRADLIRVMVHSVDGTLLPGTDIPLQAYVVPADITREDLYKPGLRSGYDLDTREWIVPPDRSLAKEVRPSLRAYAEMVVDKMKLLLMYAPEAAQEFWHQLHKSRQEAQRAGLGDHSDANVAYKAIAQAGLHPAIERVTGERIAKVETGERHVEAARTVESAWKDVQQKAVRLLRDGKITVNTNRPTVIMGHVIGDHGDYETEITRTDPNSSMIEQWECGCKWSQYAWGRTRKWKKMEGRPCSHVLALYWAAKSHPLDIADMDEGYQAPRGQRVREFTEDELFERGKGQIPGLSEQQADLGIDLDKLPRSFSPDPEPITSLPDARQQIEQQMPAQPVGPGPGPVAPRPTSPFSPPKRRKKKGPGEGQFQLFDVTAPPGGQPVPPSSPTSIPGANPPGWENPTNPTQFPGTYSSVDGWEDMENDDD